MTVPAISTRRSALWWVLLRHEWRLTVRDFRGQKPNATAGRTPPRPIGSKRVIAGWVAVAIVLHGFGAAALLVPKRWQDTPVTRIAAAAVLLFLFTLMLSTAMSRIVAAFHERRDLDLLLGAPITPDLILTVRAVTIVAAVSALFALFVYPVVDVGVVSGRWWMARLYALVPLMALLSTAVALVLTGAVVRLVGVRRARVGLQVFSALVGASFYLVSQARQLLPQGLAVDAMRWLTGAAQDDTASWTMRVPSALAGGDLPTWLVFVAACIGSFAASVRFARDRFADVARTAEADAPVVAVPRSSVERRIASGFARGLFAALLVKEWRLILRAPQLLSQILLQLLYLMPLLFVAFGRHGATVAWSAAAFAAGVVGVSATLATSLTWLTVSAEDAPDLLAGSPWGRGLILASKLVAGASPAIAIVALAAIGTSRRSAGDAALVLAFGVLACVSAAILAAASSVPGRRSDFQRRHRGRGWSMIVDATQFLLWAGAAGAAVGGYWIASIAATLVAAATAAGFVPRALRRLGDTAG